MFNGHPVLEFEENLIGREFENSIVVVRKRHLIVRDCTFHNCSLVCYCNNADTAVAFSHFYCHNLPLGMACYVDSFTSQRQLQEIKDAHKVPYGFDFELTPKEKK